MWIRQVELHNIKSYGQKTKIDLTPGLNAICGQNGAGKSTILEAIGYALFGKSAYRKQDQFVNEKAKRGEIAITVLDSRDDRLYQVVRPLKGGTTYVYDPETKGRLAEGTSDVRHWLCDCMGVEATTDLEALFENAVGVPQGLLTTSFLLTETKRRAIFDPLLGVEAYKKVFDNMRAVVNHVKDMQHENEKGQARLAGRLEDLPLLQSEAEDLEKVVKDMDSNYHQVTKTLAFLEETSAQLQKQKEAIQALENQHTTSVARRKGLQAQLEEAELALAQARGAQETVVRCEAGYQAYETADRQQEALDKKRILRDEIRRQLTEAEGALKLIQQALETLTGQLRSVSEAEAQLVALKPLAEKQVTLEQEQQSGQKKVGDLRAAQQRVAEEEQRSADLARTLIEARSQLDKRKSLADQTEKLQRQRDRQSGALDDVHQERNALRKQSVASCQSCTPVQNHLEAYDF